MARLLNIDVEVGQIVFRGGKEYRSTHVERFEGSYVGSYEEHRGKRILVYTLYKSEEECLWLYAQNISPERIIARLGRILPSDLAPGGIYGWLGEKLEKKYGAIPL